MTPPVEWKWSGMFERLLERLLDTQAARAPLFGRPPARARKLKNSFFSSSGIRAYCGTYFQPLHTFQTGSRPPGPDYLLALRCNACGHHIMMMITIMIIKLITMMMMIMR
jgi:hypothetical protein